LSKYHHNNDYVEVDAEYPAFSAGANFSPDTAKHIARVLARAS
jgi:hypothetical protein